MPDTKFSQLTNGNPALIADAIPTDRVDINGKNVSVTAGSIAALTTTISGVTVSGTPALGQVLTAADGTTASWQTPTPPVGGVVVAVLPFQPLTKSNNLVPIANTACQLVPGSAIIFPVSSSKIEVSVTTGPLAVSSMTVARTLPRSLTVIDFTAITFGGNASPTLPANTISQSDAIALVIDNQHDYWFLIYGHTGGIYHIDGTAISAIPMPFYGGYMGSGAGDLTHTSPIQNPPVPSGNLSCWLVSWLKA